MITELYNAIPIVILGLAVLSALLAQIFSNRPALRDYSSVAISVLALFVALYLLNGILNGEVPEFNLIQISPGLYISLMVDSAGMIFAALASQRA